MKPNQFISFLLIALVCSSCNSYKEITKKPNRIYDDVILPAFESDFTLTLKANISDLENKINTVLKKEYSISEEGTLAYKSWTKTKDPLYNPNELIKTKDSLFNTNKWLKTKDPLYNPKKWLKGLFGMKTKNPLYHPKKWIETINPAYHPNEWTETKDPAYHPKEWIETKGPNVAVGYQYDATMSLKENISVSSLDATTLRISVPISFKGSAGLQGNVPSTMTLNKKNFDGEIQFFVTTSISVTPDWCPKMDVKITHSWISNPQVEIMDNVYISLTGLTDKYLKELENKIGTIVNNQINCELLSGIVKEKWNYYGFGLPAFANGKQYQLNINPSRAALSNLKIAKDTLSLAVGIKGTISLNDSIINTTSKLPLLEEQAAEPNEVKVSLPLQIKYDDIMFTANKYLKENKVVLRPELLFKQKAKVQLIEMYMYPNGDEIVIGVRIRAKLPGDVIPLTGWIYLKGKPVCTNNKFEIQDMNFNMSINDEFYPTLATLFKPLIINEIKKQTTLDLTDSIASIKKQILEKVHSFQDDTFECTYKDFNCKIHDILLGNEEIAIIVELHSKLNIVLKK